MLTVIAAAAVGWSELQFEAARRSATYGGAMSQGSYRRQWATDVVVRQRRRDRSSVRIDELAADPAPASIGIAMANIRPSWCDCRQGTETGEAAPSLCRTASRCGAPASPLGGIFRRRTDNTAAVVHGYRPARKPPLVERSPEPASLQVRSNPGSRYRQDLRAGRSPSDRRSGSGHPHPSQSTAIPIASAFPQPAIEPTERTSRVVIPPFSGHSRAPLILLIAIKAASDPRWQKRWAARNTQVRPGRIAPVTPELNSTPKSDDHACCCGVVGGCEFLGTRRLRGAAARGANRGGYARFRQKP